MSHLVRKLKGKIVLLCDTNMRLGTNNPHILLIEKKVGAPEKNPRWLSNLKWPSQNFES